MSHDASRSEHVFYDREHAERPKRRIADWGGDDVFASPIRRGGRRFERAEAGDVLASRGPGLRDDDVDPLRRGPAIRDRYADVAGRDPGARDWFDDEAPAPTGRAVPDVDDLLDPLLAAYGPGASRELVDDEPGSFGFDDLEDHPSDAWYDDPSAATDRPDLDAYASPDPRWEDDDRLAPLEPGERRTVVIRGRPEPLTYRDAARERATNSVIARIGHRPERIAMWAVALGLVLVLIAVLTAGS
jgi:hypothetical protein